MPEDKRRFNVAYRVGICRFMADALFCTSITIEHLHFNFGVFKTSAHIMPNLPGMEEIAGDFGGNFFKPLLICDTNTEYLAAKIRGNANIPVCTLEAGESHKDWQAVETILRSARDAGLGRDGTFIGVGGGVISDLSAFAASIYMRGCSIALVSTTLLGMVDASLGGKTGFDLFGVKNIVGTFFPARHVYMPLEGLASLPLPEWKSGMAELIKTAILDSDDFIGELAALAAAFPHGSFSDGFPPDFASRTLAAGAELSRCVSRAVRFKGAIVEEDPLETGNRRVLLNLGHTFGHALESTAGLGTISHGEAVAWGIARSCDLALILGVCPPQRTERIRALLAAYGYETAVPHPRMGSSAAFIQALSSDKKKRSGNLSFIVPGEKSAQAVLELNMDTISQIIGMEIQ
ncbi:MAG: 3-dehydroquinate synthase [Treponema sp.]|nr:3-dehydroquinate synthase [Treponema sp.]